MIDNSLRVPHGAELGKGYGYGADSAVSDAAPHGYVIELKYLKRDQEGDAPLRSASPRPGIKRGAI